MKCIHCHKDGKMLVLESRPVDGTVYRRRSCGFCGANFVTSEVYTGANYLPRVRDRSRRAQRQISSDGAHLQAALSNIFGGN